MKALTGKLAGLILALCLLLSACGPSTPALEPLFLSDIPPFSGEAYVVLNDNHPGFAEEDLTTETFSSFAELDPLGRCGVAFACVGQETMPTEERGSIGQVKPSGWHTVKYDCVDGKYLYNRCHLIGYQLTGENANELNLITGTRYMNVEGMLPFENMVADYIQETDNHVLYRVTPIFTEDYLVADGVQMEALSVEDDGEGICFNVYVYNVQPGVVIEYATGESWLEGTEPADGESPGDESTGSETTYILNTGSQKFHYPDCASVDKMSEENRETFTGTREELIDMGYSPCGQCNP